MVIRAMALLVCAALAACTIKDIDYTGKACPCPAGYLCNTPTQTCVKSNEPDPDGGNSTIDMGSSDGSAATDSCFGSAPATLSYSSVGFPDFPGSWLQGVGSWVKEQGELQQQNAANEIAWLSRSDMMSGNQTNYRVVVTAHVIDTLGQGGAGVAFRTTTPGSLYACELDPLDSVLRLHRVAGGFQDVVLMMRTLSPPIGDVRDTFRVEAMATGASLQCCVRGYSGMVVSAQDAQIPSGSVGLASFRAEAGFSEIYVYE